MSDESYLEKLPGIRDIIDDTAGGAIVLPRVSRLRIKGNGVVLTPRPDAIELEITGEAGPDGNQGPPGTQGGVGNTGPAGTLLTIGRLDGTHSPAGLWHFNGSLADSSGNSRTFTVDAGSAVYAELWPGFKGIDLNGLTRLVQTDAAFRILGDVTYEMVCVLNATPNGLALFAQQDAGETLATNTSAQVSLAATRLLTWTSEHSTGIDDTYALTAAALPPPGVPFHYAVTRTANVVQHYVNGVAHGPASSALTAPDGGTTSKLSLGGGVTTLGAAFLCAEFKVIASGLNSTQVAAEAERSIGQLY